MFVLSKRQEQHKETIMTSYYSQFRGDDLIHWQGKDMKFSQAEDEEEFIDEDLLVEQDDPSDEPLSMDLLGMSWRDFM